MPEQIHLEHQCTTALLRLCSSRRRSEILCYTNESTADSKTAERPTNELHHGALPYSRFG
jgi:hypothetical protein